MEKEIMTPSNNRWNEFYHRLVGIEGCNFRQKEKDNTESIIWNCNSKPDRPFATKILESMGNIDIKKTMVFFDEKHGHCDCEIIFNVQQP